MKKIYLSALLMLTMLLSGCVQDDGTYDYHELAEISIENVPELTEVLAYVDNIQISPRFVSSTEGEIKADDPNYTVQYRFGYKGIGNFGYDYDKEQSILWKDLTPESGFDINIPANFSTGTYTLWITITDNRNNSVTSEQFDISIGSTTYEGWLVLCNEGDEERARLDMISKLSSTRTEAIHDIAAGLPTLHHATCINAFPQMASPGDRIHLFTREGSYDLDNETLECAGVSDEFNANNFAFDPGETIIKEDVFAASTYNWLQKYRICFGEGNNVYVFAGGTGGAAYSTPVNTLEEGTSASFHVAPYVGYSWARPWSKSYAANMLFYDTDNQRFLLYQGGSNLSDDGRLQLYVIPDPSADESQLFSYSTGKDFVYMQSTRRSTGLVYTILQDPSTGKRSIYGLNLISSTPLQELYIADVDAPDFDKATQFAFDNRFPLLFYSVGTKLYVYNVGTKQSKELSIGLGSQEEITKLKFNLYRSCLYSNLTNQSDDFMNQQYRLIICSYDGTTNGGKVTFFDVDGTNESITKGEQYDGFAKIVDITYREREE